MKTLCVDLGNTRMKAAIFDDGKIIHLSVFDGDILSSVQALIKQFNPQKSILSSVIHHDQIPWGLTDLLWQQQWFISFQEKTIW
jgi:pantothenate kinase type III